MTLFPDTAPPPATLPPAVRGLIADRVDEAFARGDLPFTVDQMAALLRAILPEEFAVTVLAPAPTVTPPGTAERASVYARRASARMSVFHPEDAWYQTAPLGVKE